MNEDMKSNYIQQHINAYLDGAIPPEIDLSAAKKEVRRSRTRRRGKIAASVLSAVASVVIVIALAVYLVPALANRNVYSIADATPSASSYTALAEEYPDLAAPFAPFSFATNADAEYSVYEMEGEPVLMRAELSFVGSGYQARASVYIDLTNGAKTPKEFSAYKDLKKAGDYRTETVYMNGEFVSRAYCTLAEGNACYVDMTANYGNALGDLMRTIRR